MEKELLTRIAAASGISRGELVLIQFWGEDKDVGIMHAAAEAAVALGASPVEIQQSRSVNARRFTEFGEGAFGESYFKFMSNFDAVIDIFSYRPVVIESFPDGFKSDEYQKYMSSLFGALSKAKRFTQIRIPTEENAKESGLSFKEYSNRMYAAMDIDYSALRNECEKAVSGLRKKSELVLTTGYIHKLRFELKDRKWFIDAGDGDIPAGEVYIAPIEGKTNGAVYFETLYAGDWGKFRNIILSIKNGVILSSNNDELNEHLSKMDESFKIVCELGFGKNPNVKDLCGFTVLDEKTNGTFHIAIGNNTMFGGQNDVPLHMDFVGVGIID